MIWRIVKIQIRYRISPVGNDGSGGKNARNVFQIRQNAFIYQYGTSRTNSRIAKDIQYLRNDNNTGNQKPDDVIPDEYHGMFHHVFQISVFFIPSPDEIKNRKQTGHVEQIIAVQKQEEDHEDKEEWLLFTDITVNR